MGYTAYVYDLDWKIKPGQEEAALQALKKQGIADGGFGCEIDNLRDSLASMDIETDLVTRQKTCPDAGEQLVFDAIDISNYRGMDDYLKALAPFSEPGSYVMWLGEGDEFFRDAVTSEGKYVQDAPVAIIWPEL